MVQGTGGTHFRLVLNSQFYEGLRYGWLHVLQGSKQTNKQGNDNSSNSNADAKSNTDASSTPPSFSIGNWTAVCQVLPVNYHDHAFETAGSAVPAGSSPGAGAAAFAEVWHTALYTTRVDILAPPALFGSILMDRGDRISWTGDAHLAQKAALAGFGDDHGTSMVKRNLIRTQTGDNGIISYDMYWILSLVDYYMHSGDEATLANAASVVLSKLQTSTAFWSKPTHQHFCGSDERIGADFNGLVPSNDEKSRYYKMLSVQAAQEYAKAAAMCGAGCSAEMKQAAATIGATFASFFQTERASTAPSWSGYEWHRRRIHFDF